MMKDDKVKLMNKFNAKRSTKGYAVEVFPLRPNLAGKYGLNWSAVGTVSLKDSNKFITQLKAATKLVRKLNK